MIVNALVDKPLSVYGDGLNIRDWLYVEDTRQMCIRDRGISVQRNTLQPINVISYITIPVIVKECIKQLNN